MNNQTNQSTASLEELVQKNEQQQSVDEADAKMRALQERAVIQQDLKEILQRLEQLQMSVDMLMDVK